MWHASVAVVVAVAVEDLEKEIETEMGLGGEASLRNSKSKIQKLVKGKQWRRKMKMVVCLNKLGSPLN